MKGTTTVRKEQKESLLRRPQAKVAPGTLKQLDTLFDVFGYEAVDWTFHNQINKSTKANDTVQIGYTGLRGAETLHAVYLPEVFEKVPDFVPLPTGEEQ